MLDHARSPFSLLFEGVSTEFYVIRRIKLIIQLANPRLCLLKCHQNSIGFGVFPLKKCGLFLCTLLIAICLTILTTPTQAAGSGKLKIKTQSGTVQFKVEYAITPAEKAKGLMYRTSLPHNTGMLFIYQKPTLVTMWMKNTPLSLDMFFINKMGRIRFIEEKTQPNSTRQIHSGGQISAVLELPAGSAENHGIKVGDLVILPN